MGKITFFAPDTDAFADSVIRHIEEYKEKTNDEVKLRIIPSDEYFSNRIQPYLEQRDGADVYMSGPVLLWEHIGAGYVQELDEFIRRADDGFCADDFLPILLQANRWTGKFLQPLGTGPLLGIPVNCESYNISYHKEVLERLGLNVPKTWKEYYGTAYKVAQNVPNIYGFAQRGAQAWHTMYTGFATQFWSEGGVDFLPNGRCAIASPVAVKITEEFIRALRACGPPDWTGQRWYELAWDFCAGKYGLIVDSDHYVAYYEDEKKSAMARKIGYALPPVGREGKCAPNLWTWSLVMNARAVDKEAAWRFISWAAGKEFLARAVLEGNMNPTRKSIWESEPFQEYTKEFGEYYNVCRSLLEQYAKVVVTPAQNYRSMAQHWVRALREAYGGRDVEEALVCAAYSIDELAQQEVNAF